MNLTTLYILTIGVLGMLVHASHILRASAQTNSITFSELSKPKAEKVIRHESGKPTRINIPTSNINLPVDDGYYDSKTGTWSLSPSRAQYAVMSPPANNQKGATFIYGHGTPEVFGSIGSRYPSVGTKAYVDTDNGKRFTYTLHDIHQYRPSDTTILKGISSGSPRLIVQTCTGVFGEWRTWFIFSLQQVTS